MIVSEQQTRWRASDTHSSRWLIDSVRDRLTLSYLFFIYCTMIHTASLVSTIGNYKQFKVNNTIINLPTDAIRYLTDNQLNNYLTDACQGMLHGEKVKFTLNSSN